MRFNLNMLYEKDNKIMEKWYCIWLAIMPVLAHYGFAFMPYLGFADYGLGFFYLIRVAKATKTGKMPVDKCFLGLNVYFVVQLLIFALYVTRQVDIADAIGTSLRLLYTLFPLCLMPTCCETSNYHFKKAFRIVGIITSLYGILQYIFGTYLHISLSPYIPFLPILREGLDKQQEGWISYGWTVRARSFFSEPSTFSIYLILALALELFEPNNTKNKKVIAIYIAGILASRSSTGILGLMFCFGLLTLEFVKKKHWLTGKRTMIGMLFLLPFLFFALCKSGYVESFINHTFASGQGLSGQSHFNGISEAFKNDSSFLEIIFGHGLQQVQGGGKDRYLPGWIRTYYCLGVVGTLLYAVSFFKIYCRTSSVGKKIILLFVFLNLGTEIMLGKFMLLYMSVAMTYSRNKVLNDA